MDISDFDSIPADEQRMALALARKGNRHIGPTNEQFAAMVPSQQRVAIAADVLEWLRIGKLVAEPGTYLSVRDPEQAQHAHGVSGGVLHL